ncbi:diguanylate cyclase [Rhizobium sp. SSA_523]|uniref:diguanylate cyclase n=1 Tax=Rhizobium sp. SSA_523 TaxID=2952477 RepID=UPI00209188F2|nr:diguanylate cyclase [Rhizobium sp. SSA_523]MCO5730972.1 diguanylate cyclase [Rhizobium sp. SSA_523]WKC24220.1 diguanylate cyclase [Rhizobium sp. SSA_523]
MTDAMIYGAMTEGAITAGTTTAGTTTGSVMAAAEIDPLERVRHRLLRIATAHDIDDGESTRMIQSLDTIALMDQFPEWLTLKDRRGRLVFANAAVLAKAGASALSDIFGKTVFDILGEERAEERFLLEQQLMSLGETHEQEELARLPDGQEVWLWTTRTPLRDREGRVAGLIVMSREITERKREEGLRKDQAAVLEMVARGKPLTQILEGICRLVQRQLNDIRASFLLADEEGARLHHGEAPDLPLAYTRLVDGVEIGPRAGSCGTAAWRRSTVIVRDIETDPLWANFRDIALIFGLRSCWSTPVLSSEREVLGTLALYSATVREPTDREMELALMATDLAAIAIERTRNEDRIRHMAHHDPLTGLPNRALFWPQFSRMLNEARREGRNVTVAYIDLDNFKQINDGFGHAAGDEVLKILSSRLQRSVRSSDLLVRLGGDEFAIVFSNPAHEHAGVLRRLGDIRSHLGEAMEVEGEILRPTSSMGIAFFPQDGATPEELLACADRFMYQAKAQGRDTMEVAPPPSRFAVAGE